MTEILAGGFLPGVKPYWREDSIFYTARRIRCEPVPFVRIKGRDRFYETNCADRDEILGFFFQILIFFDDMGDQAEIALNEDVFCFEVSLRVFLDVVLFFGRGEGIRK